MLTLGVPQLKKALRRFGRDFSTFVAKPASPRPFALLRIGVCLVLLLQGVALWEHRETLYGRLGIIQAPIAEMHIPDNVPTLGWVVDALEPHGVSESDCITGFFALYLASLVGLLVGWRTRLMAVAAWLTHYMLKMTGNSAAYGVEEFANIALFYCIVFPAGRAWSLDVWSGRTTGEATPGARLALRVLQFHVCIVYFSSGVEKATGEQWWNGEAIWRAVMRPDFAQFDMSWLAYAPIFAKLLCWGTLFIEIGYVFLVWPRWTRKWMALATLSLHLGIGLMMGLWGFAAVMMLLTASAWLVPSEPRTERSRVRSPEPMPALAGCAA